MKMTLHKLDFASTRYAWVSRWSLAIILALALIVRVVLTAWPSFHHPDEVFQYLEPAHRIATGYGIVTWEWREGIRSWFVPLLMALPIMLSERLTPGSLNYLWMIREGFAVASLVIVVAFYVVGKRVSQLHGLVAAFIAAIWFEIVFFAGHPLSEPLAVTLIVPAAALLCGSDASARRLATAGLLLGLAVIVRFQYAPAIGVLVLFACRLEVRRAWLPMAAGFAVAAAVGAAVDLSFGRWPFAWVISNVDANLIQGKSEDFGVSGPVYLIRYLTAFVWQAYTPIIVVLALVGARRFPALLVAAAVNLLVHSLITHKEYRFIALSSYLMLLLFSIGLVDVFRLATNGLRPPVRSAVLATILLCVTSASVLLGMGERFRYEWLHSRAPLEAMMTTRRVEGLCGVAVYGLPFYSTGGYSYLNRRVPLYLFREPDRSADVARGAAAYNVLIAPTDREVSIPSSYQLVQCNLPSRRIGSDPSVPEEAIPACIYRRPGSCIPSAHDFNQEMIRLHQ